MAASVLTITPSAIPLPTASSSSSSIGARLSADMSANMAITDLSMNMKKEAQMVMDSNDEEAHLNTDCCSDNNQISGRNGEWKDSSTTTSTSSSSVPRQLQPVRPSITPIIVTTTNDSRKIMKATTIQKHALSDTPITSTTSYSSLSSSALRSINDESPTSYTTTSSAPISFTRSHQHQHNAMMNGGAGASCYRSNSTRSTSSISSTSSSSSIVHAIDFAYPSGSFDGSYTGRRAGAPRSSMSLASACRNSNNNSFSYTSYGADSTASTSNNGRRRSSKAHHHHHQQSTSYSSTSSSASVSTSASSSAAAAYCDGMSSSSLSSSSATSSRRSSSTSSSSSLACQFKEWALSADRFDDRPLSGYHLNNNDPKKGRLPSYGVRVHHHDHHHHQHLDTTSTNARQSLAPLSFGGIGSGEEGAVTTTRMATTSNNASGGGGGEIFSPMTDVPPLPPSVFPPGMMSEDEDIEDIDGIVCFQPGCNTTISPGTYYCQQHDDPFGDDA